MIQDLEYTSRTYRQHFSNDRWKSFVVKHKETDIWVGVDYESFVPDMQVVASEAVRSLRDTMDKYLEKDSEYRQTLQPYAPFPDAPPIMKQMAEASVRAGVGPMASVAGAFAYHIVNELKARFSIREIMIENGGDIYADIKEDIDVSVFAGASPLSEKIGLHIEAGESPLGICTSSGTVGPSLSFGKADAVMIVCKDVLLADSYATSFANRIQTSDDFDPVLADIKQEEAILSALLIKDDKVAIIGRFGMKLFN